MHERIGHGTRHAASYLSDTAFEYAFGGEDLVSDLLQFHVDDRRP